MTTTQAAAAGVTVLLLGAAAGRLIHHDVGATETSTGIALDGKRSGGAAGGGAAERRGSVAGKGTEPDGGASRGAGLYVHVAGAVRRPGLYRLPAGSRVASAVSRAGGASRRANLDGVNLASPLEDGQQVIVPQTGAASPGGRAVSAGAAAAGGAQPVGAQVSLSSATVEQLDSLDGIGPTLAARIIEHRDSHGGFRSLEQLAEVEGIGEKRLAALRKALRP